MELTNNQSKIDLVSRLVKEGAIDFNEAIELLKVETKNVYSPLPFSPQPNHDPLNPYRSKLIKEVEERLKQKRLSDPFEIKMASNTN